jgi:hypothetical protein
MKNGLWLGVVCMAAAALAAPKPEYQAGVARLKITPEGPIWMSGYAGRTGPSRGVAQELFTKAIAIEDKRGYRLVVVTTDLIGLPREVAEPVAARVEKEYGLRRAQLLLNSSHTHTGPVVWPNLRPMFDLDAGQQKVVEAYARKLTDDLVTVVGGALADLAPVTIHYAQGAATFAVNRRTFSREGTVKFGVNRKSPSDHSVPVLEFKEPGGKRKAILFGYACHNTTLTGADLELNGDYAGTAQAELESQFTGTTALFVALCGADQNPEPRGKAEMAVAHGKTLAAAVADALNGKTEPIHGRIRSTYRVIDLALAPHTREQFEEESKDSNPYQARRARLMLEKYDQGRPPRTIPYPVQVVRFEKALTLIALGGEVVVDYALRARRQLPDKRLMVLGYSNDVMCYIPSVRILREGGYEAEGSMVYYGLPGRLTEDVEDTIFAAITR